MSLAPECIGINCLSRKNTIQLTRPELISTLSPFILSRWWKLHQLYKLFTGSGEGVKINENTSNCEQFVTFTKTHTTVLETWQVNRWSLIAITFSRGQH